MSLNIDFLEQNLINKTSTQFPTNWVATPNNTWIAVLPANTRFFLLEQEGTSLVINEYHVQNSTKKHIDPVKFNFLIYKTNDNSQLEDYITHKIYQILQKTEDAFLKITTASKGCGLKPFIAYRQTSLFAHDSHLGLHVAGMFWAYSVVHEL